MKAELFKGKVRQLVARHQVSVVYAVCSREAYRDAGNTVPRSADTTYDVYTLAGRPVVENQTTMPDAVAADNYVRLMTGKGKKGPGKRASVKPVKQQRCVSMYESQVEFALAHFQTLSKAIELSLKFYEMHHKPGTPLFDVTPNHAAGSAAALPFASATAHRPHGPRPTGQPTITELDAMPESAGDSAALPAGSDAPGLFDDI